METFLIVLLILIVIVVFSFLFFFIFNSKKDYLENYLNHYPRRNEIPDIIFNGDVDTTWENWDSKPEVLSSMANFLNQSFEYYLNFHDVANFTNMETVITKYLDTAPLNPEGKVPWGKAIDELYFSYMCKPLANFSLIIADENLKLSIATFILNYIKYPNQSFITEVSGVYIYSLGIPWAIANYILNGIVNTSLITQGIQKEMNYENLDGTKVLYDGGYLVRDKVVDYESLINLQQDIKLLQTLGFRIPNSIVNINSPLGKILDRERENTTGTFSSSRFTANTTSPYSTFGIDVIPSIGFIRLYNEEILFSCRGSKMYIAAFEQDKLSLGGLEFYYSHRDEKTLNYRYATVLTYPKKSLEGFKTSNFFDEASSVCGMLNGEGILINKYKKNGFVSVEEILCLSTINNCAYHMITMKNEKEYGNIYYVTGVDNYTGAGAGNCWVIPFYGVVSDLTLVVYPLDNNEGYFLCSDSSSKVPRVAMYNIPPTSLKYTTKINNVEYTTTFDGKQFVFDKEVDFTGDLTPLPSTLKC